MKLICILFTTVILLNTNVLMVQAQHWEERSSTPFSARHHPVGFGIGDVAYVGLGWSFSSSFSQDFYMYTPEDETWEKIGDFPGGGRSYSYGISYEGKGYVGFGVNADGEFLNDLWRFDPATQEWEELESCPCPGRKHPAFIAHEGKIFMGLGDDFGLNGGSNYSDWWEYDIESDSWTQRDDLPGPPRHHPYHFQAGDYVYAGMGHGFAIFDDWYRYDLNTHEWTQMNDHPGLPRAAGQEFSYNGKGYVISGDGPGHDNLEYGEFWEYHAENDTWIRLADHPGVGPDGRVGRWAPGAFVVNNYAYFFGGVNRGSNTVFNDMWSYDLEQPVSVADAAKNVDFQIYPNPANDFIVLNGINQTGEIASVNFYDARGINIKSVTTGVSEISVSDLPQGLYILSIQTTSGYFYRSRFIKE